MIITENTTWDATYDVIVVGFGGAGATAARFAADHQAKVLLIDAAPEGHEGGNTRYAGQIVESGTNFADTKKYYQQLTAPMDLDEEMLNTFVQGLTDMPQYFRQYLDIEPFSAKAHMDNPETKQLAFMAAEYPEFAGSQASDNLLVHGRIFDAALWKILRQKVLEQTDQIDILYSTPAQHLLQQADRTIVGVQIKREDRMFNVYAKNGVILTLGGFENNNTMIQDYLGERDLLPYGTLYNNGDGIKMAIEVGADLWHMQNYEPGGVVNFAEPHGSRARNILGWDKLRSGSIISVGDDGTRFIPEDDITRHGHRYNHGLWRIPLAQRHPYLIFDHKQYEELKAQPADDYHNHILSKVIQAATLDQLAEKIHVQPKTLQRTIQDFNFFVQQGKDYQYQRDPQTMTAFSDEGPYYAIAQQHTMLNTQGGPRRNAHAEILDTNQQVIPHLYGAGELGHVNANQYNGGGDLADCLIFGKIAGENAARPKTDQVNPDAHTSASVHSTSAPFPTSDANKTVNYSTAANQYLGESLDGIGDQIVVRVTVDEHKKIQNIEVLQQSESEDYGQKALSELPAQMIAANTYQVDNISGASSSSRALKEAVKNALDKIP